MPKKDSLETTASLLSSLKNPGSWFSEKKTWRLLKPEEVPNGYDIGKHYAKAFETVINGCDKRALFELIDFESIPDCELNMIYPFYPDTSTSSTSSEYLNSIGEPHQIQQEQCQYIELRGRRTAVEYMSHEFLAVPDAIICMTDSKTFVNDQDSTCTILCSYTYRGTRTQNVRVSGEYNVGTSKNSLFTSKYGLSVTKTKTTPTSSNSRNNNTNSPGNPATVSAAASDLDAMEVTQLQQQEHPQQQQGDEQVTAYPNNSYSHLPLPKKVRPSFDRSDSAGSTASTTTASFSTTAAADDAVVTMTTSGSGSSPPSESGLSLLSSYSSLASINTTTHVSITAALGSETATTESNKKKKKSPTSGTAHTASGSFNNISTINPNSSSGGTMNDVRVLLTTSKTRFAHTPLQPTESVAMSVVGTIKFYLNGDKKITRLEVLNCPVKGLCYSRRQQPSYFTGNNSISAGSAGSTSTAVGGVSSNSSSSGFGSSSSNNTSGHS